VEIYMQNQWSGKRVLVTGGCGFVGSHLVAKLVELGAEVSVFDNLSTGHSNWIPDHVALWTGDCRDEARLSYAVAGQDFVFHLAAHADVRRNMNHPREVWESNADATLNLLTCMRSAHVDGLAFASSGIVYGRDTLISSAGPVCPWTEDGPHGLDADSIYGASKIACEHLIKAFELETSLRAWRFRFSGLLGPRYTHGHVADFVRSLQRDPTRLEVLGNGYQEKAYLDVRDCVNGMVEIIDTDKPGAYNLASSETLVIRDSVKQICEAMGVTPQVTYGDTAGGWPSDPPTIHLSPRHPIPARPLSQSLADTVAYLRARIGNRPFHTTV
jgi:UDP-glucose 4-epimerase